jgi:hypothetical protein
VTFNLAVDVDDEMFDGGEEEMNSISSPIRDVGHYCTMPNECALHRVASCGRKSVSDDESPPSSDIFPSSGRCCRFSDPPIGACSSVCSLPTRRHDAAPRLGRSASPSLCAATFPVPCPVAPTTVFLAMTGDRRSPFSRVSPADELRPSNGVRHFSLSTASSLLPMPTYPCTGQVPGGRSTSPATSPSYAVGRCSTFGFSRSQGSLTDSGQGGHSDPDDYQPTPSPYGRQPRFMYNLPSESEASTGN